jgi:hypothetical protein
MTQATVRKHSNPTVETHHRTLTSSARKPAETASAFLNRVLEISDDDVRERLIDDAYRALIDGDRADRRFWMEVMNALIEGRSEAVKARRHAEFLTRVG